MKKLWSLILALAIAVAIPATTTAIESPVTPVPPPEIEEIIEEVQTIYRLTVYYIYIDGTPAAPTITKQLNVGTNYNVPSPTIPDYTPSAPFVAGEMPARNIEYTVIYIPLPHSEDQPDPDQTTKQDQPYTYYTIDDYDTPLGLGATYMHIGICIE